jgi:AsmA protein
VKRLLSKRAVGAVCVVLLVLFMLRPGAGWMRARVSNSISQALGRNVSVGTVRLRFLPRPGFEIDDLLVRDAPAFGNEPLVRAPQVEASVSLGALLRGHIEIARLSLSDPSLNLTRNAQGKWNLEDLIDRTSHTALAPTGAPRISAGPAFPYVEATSARVNLKVGSEKTHFALTNADLALWQESDNTWGARLKARPIRTDANLTDTGVVTASGLWRRSSLLHQTPIQISFQWKQAQIGQVSELVYGADKNWRGAALFSGAILGTPERLKLAVDASIDDFRHQDVIGGGNLSVAAHCSGDYAPATRELANLDCTGPAGGGYVQLKGSAIGILEGGKPFNTADLWLVVNHAAAASVVAALRNAHADFPGDLKVSGDVSSTVHITRADQVQPVSVQGAGSIENLQIARNNADPVELTTVPFTVTNGPDRGFLSDGSAHNAKKSRGVRSRTAREEDIIRKTDELRAELGPVSLAVSKSGFLTAQATLTRGGFIATTHGDTGLQRLLQLARALSIPAPPVAGGGAANVSLRVSGEWFSGDRPVVSGSARLRSVTAQVRGLNAPLQLLSADLTIDPDVVTVQNVSAIAAEATWHGSLRIPRPCPTPDVCEIEFKLHSDKLNASALNTLLNPALRPRAWYRFLSLGKDQPSYLLQARAAGKISIDKISFGSTTCSRFTSDLSLEAGTLSLGDFKASCLGGTASGKWEADFTAKPPQYSGTGSFDGVSLASIANLMRDDWVDGSGGARYDFKASGSTFQDLLSTAEVNARFSILNGMFNRVVFARGSGPLRAADFSGTLHLSDGEFSFQEAKLTTGSEVYTVSGTASLGGALNLKALTGTAGGYAISGTLLKTRVSAIPNAEASLKP